MPLTHTIIGSQRKYERTVCNAVFTVLKGCTMFVLVCWFFSGHVGAESLSFRYRLADLPARIDLSMGYWQLPGGNEHQNTVLRLYQDSLKAKGVTNTEALHYAAAILVSENEPLTTDRLGDYGHAFGICQKNIKPAYARDFLQRNPEWQTVEKQVDFCSDRFAAAWARYADVFRAVVEHNCPACAAAGVDSTRANHKPLVPSYFTRVTNATYKLALL